MATALIVVDVQNDFCEGGSLAVAGGSLVARNVSELLKHSAYDVVVATKDHHIDPGDHFSAEPDFTHSWPAHCQVGTTGEAFHPDLDTEGVDEIFLKGEYAAAYSGFEGVNGDGIGLATWLRDRAVDEVDVCGLATDYCVRATALDAAQEGFMTRLITDLCAGVAPQTTAAALEEMAAAGVQLR